MLRQQLPASSDRMDDGVGEMLRFEMRAASPASTLPRILAAFLVHASISDDRKLLRARRNEDQNGVAFRVCVMPSCSNCARASDTASATFPR